MENSLTPPLSSWFSDHGIPVLIILAGVWIVRRVGRIALEKIVRRTIRPNGASPEAEKKREDTFISVFHGIVNIGAWIVGSMMILSELGVDIGPLIAAAGIAGLAFGFGGQYLIRDVIAGLFLLLENHYRVGDVVCLDGTCGLVEDISLRMTTLRDLDGTVHHVPNGAVQKSSNLSKGFSRVNLNIGVSYGAKIEHVIEVVNRVGQELASDPEWKDSIIKPPEFLRIDDFGDSAVVIKILGETKPIKQWDVAGELRKRLKIAFDSEGIEIPFPQRVIHTQTP